MSKVFVCPKCEGLGILPDSEDDRYFSPTDKYDDRICFVCDGKKIVVHEVENE